ncbi:hypothetical protein DY023_16405 [Microbacterium bovistercoris]|uniref:Uncharacterized protein n=1 Tax=Microbacterium bovistercoris TaxID=2293570 RepID=A0A371NNY9_9MICO|nr:hypothetical protein [Microbacterium bovistercoris]REJ03903.1 hypothetical protein DY023_16405 [Microbacterium bovistercoris]
MSDQDAAKDARAQRRTWVIGGLLLVLAALVGFVARFERAWMHPAQNVLWAFGVLVLVIGLGRAGSITGRRPLATTTVLLQLAVANPLTAAFVSSLVPQIPDNLYEQEDAQIAVTFPYLGLVLVLTVATVILIGLAGAVPRPWNWAPAGVLAIAAISSFASLRFVTADGAARVAGRILFELPGVGVLFLGVLAIVLGARATRHPASSQPAEDSAVGG